MTISELSVKRKVAMSAFLVMLVFLGVRMYSKIGIDSLPKFNVPYVLITTVYAGASPEELEVDVAKPIEDAVASLDGLKHTTTVCMENACTVTLEFELGTDVDIMVHDVREKLNRIVDQFPSGVETPTLSKVNVNAIPVVTLYLTGRQSVDELYDYADETLSDMFSCLSGVGEVRLHGGNEMQLHVILDREKLTESGLTAETVISRIASSNLKIPVGRLREDGRETTVTYDAEYRDIQDLKNLEISNQGGKRIYLGDLADIRLQAKEIRQVAYLNGEPAVQIEIVKKSDANAVKVIDAITRQYRELVEGGMLPGGMKLHWFRDAGAFIHASVDDAWSSIFLGIGLTALLLFMFLHDIRSTFIAVLSMPVSIAISFILMKWLDYTFDMMTLVSLGCSTGVLVTNAVVVLENIFKRMHGGEDAVQASIRGTDEVIIAVAASALTNVVVFVPVALMSSIVGLLISPFAGVMVVATLTSLFVSFTLTPILASRFYSGKEQRKQGRLLGMLFGVWNSGYDRLERLFGRSMDMTRRHCWLVIIVCVVISVVLMLLSVPHIRMSFIPANDKSELAVSLEYPANTTLEIASERTLSIMKEIQSRPEIASAGCTVGYVNTMPGKVTEGVYLADIGLNLVDKQNRGTLEDVSKMIRDLLARHGNLQYAVNIPSPLGSSGAEINFHITGPDYQVLQNEAKKVIRLLEQSGLAGDIDTSIRSTKPRVNIRPDRTVLRNLGTSESSFGTMMLGYFDGVEAGSYKVGTRTYDIRVKTTPLESLSAIDSLSAGMIEGHPVGVTAFAEIESSPVSISIVREDRQRAAKIYCNPINGATMGDVMTYVRKNASQKLPHGYTLQFAAQAEMMDSATAEFGEVFSLAIVLTYLLIAALMESWGRPFLILFTIPLGFVGMFTMMWLTDTALSMIGLLGGVMMIGIVVNNAILIMDETASLQRNGMTPHDSMKTATVSKFRPVLMTSIASVCGMLPMAFGTGLGSELRSSCGIGVVGGLVFAAVMTLYLIPALYFAFVKNHSSNQN